MKVCEEKKIRRNGLEIEVGQHIDWDWNIHFCMISHVPRLISYNDLCMLDLWFFLRCLSQISINPNYDFRDSFMKLVWTLLIIFSKLV